MSAQIITLKIICGFFIIAALTAIGYFNMIWTWGVELKSATSFFGCLLLSSFLTFLMQAVMSLKDE